MKKITESNISELREGDLICFDEYETLKYSGWNNGHIWEFYGIVFENDDDMDGHFSEEKVVRLTKSELIYHAKVID